jgi:serine/threonine protein kinase
LNNEFSGMERPVGLFTENDIILKNYRIEKSIGQGAFGDVFLATHLGLNGLRAVKVLLRDQIGMGSSDYDEYRSRFHQESQLMEWFRHPNIVSVYDFLEEDNILYLVMEFATGGSLQNKFDVSIPGSDPLSIEEVIRISLDVAEGLSALHEKDVVHRDLKPSNILFDAGGRAKVADLGLAQVPGGGSLRSQLSILQPHPGTPAYMSPEQEIAGAYLRPSSDIYTLGLIMFELLTGRSYKNIRPGTRIDAYVPSAPEWFSDLLNRMLSETPEDRPWDGSELAKKLRAGSEGVSVKVEHTPQPEEDPALLAEMEKQRVEVEKRARLDNELRARREEEERFRLANLEKANLRDRPRKKDSRDPFKNLDVLNTVSAQTENLQKKLKENASTVAGRFQDLIKPKTGPD